MQGTINTTYLNLCTLHCQHATYNRHNCLLQFKARKEMPRWIQL